MPLTAGTRLGSYEIAGLVGAGGMGEVYRARDTRLNRDVAIKVLPDYYAGDPEWLVRFEREAQLLALLNHPHIAQIYGFEDPPPTGSGQVVRGLVMELVDGPTLADRIANGAVPLDESLPIARQIAEALEAAHERGIIHRDLKPANIKLTAGGAVKVLDFGLAKVREPLAGPNLGGAIMNSPTIASPITASGAILGTAAYMAPEQARGKAVDKRADIWAFGVVLYEMLTGHRPFQGETLSDTVAAVLHKEIDWARLPADTPDELRRMLRRCLTRDPKDRLHDAADARLVLTDVQREGHAEPVTRRPTRTPWRPIGAAALAIATIGVVTTRLPFTRSPGAAPLNGSVRFAIEPPPDVMSVSSVTISADGRFIVYEAQVEGEYRLFIRRLDALDSRPLAGTEGARGPFISPDGEWIGFFRGARLYKVSMSGGEPLVVCKVQGGSGAAWNTDGRIVFSRAFLSGLSIVSADGGAPTVVTTPDPRQQEIGHWWPSVLPGGRVLFTIIRATTGLNDARIGLLDLSTGKSQVLFAGARAAWLPSGHIVFYRTGRYHAVAFDPSSFTVTGEPFAVLDDAQELDPAGDFPQPVAVGQSGALAYLPGPYVPLSRLTWIDASGRFTPLSFAPRPFVGVKLSPDGRRIATASLEAGRLLIRLFDLERGADEALNIDGMNWNPVWLPDGRLSFTSMRKGDFDVCQGGGRHRRRARGAGGARRHRPDCVDPRRPPGVSGLRTGQHLSAQAVRSAQADQRHPTHRAARRQRRFAVTRRALARLPVRCRGSIARVCASADHGRTRGGALAGLGGVPDLPTRRQDAGSRTRATAARAPVARRQRSLRDWAGAHRHNTARVRVGLDLWGTVRRGGRREVPCVRPYGGDAASPHTSRARMGPRGDATRIARPTVTRSTTRLHCSWYVTLPCLRAYTTNVSPAGTAQAAHRAPDEIQQ
jgi:serine/threonine-protein kinase